MFFFSLILLFSIIFTLLDIRKKINLMHFLPLSLYLALLLNLIVFAYWLKVFNTINLPERLWIASIVVIALFLFYIWLRLNIFPVRDGKKVGPRLKAMIGGRFLIYAGLWSLTIEILFLIFSYPYFFHISIPKSILIYNAIFGAVISFFLIWNGIIRIFFTSRRLSIVRRVIIILTIWIPLVNLFLLLYTCRLVYEEYDFACKLPEAVCRFIAKIVNRIFRKLGDKNPDFYTAIRQFSAQTSREFNSKGY